MDERIAIPSHKAIPCCLTPLTVPSDPPMVRRGLHSRRVCLLPLWLGVEEESLYALSATRRAICPGNEAAMSQSWFLCCPSAIVPPKAIGTKSLPFRRDPHSSTTPTWSETPLSILNPLTPSCHPSPDRPHLRGNRPTTFPTPPWWQVLFTG